MKYSKTHPTPKRPRRSILDSISNDKTNENVVVEERAEQEDAHNLLINRDKKSKFYLIM